MSAILKNIEQALLSSVTSFEQVANGRWGCDKPFQANRMPESWIVSCLMRRFHELDFAAFPEVNVNQDLQCFHSMERALSPDDISEFRGAKFDLFLCDPSRADKGATMPLRVAVEIKGPKSIWKQFPKDIQRVEELRTLLSSPEQAAVFAYVSCPLKDDKIRAESKKLKSYAEKKRKSDEFMESQISSAYEGVAHTFMYVCYGG